MREIVRILAWGTGPLNVAAEPEARRFDPGTPKSVVPRESCALYGTIVAELTALFERLGLTAGADPSTALGMTASADPSTEFTLSNVEGLGMTDDATDSGER